MDGSYLLQVRIAQWAQSKPDKVFLSEVETGNQLSFAQLAQGVQNLKNYLGSEPKTVLVALPGGIVDATLWLACLSGGHLLIPISPMVTDTEFQAAAEKHRPDVVVLDSSQVERANDMSVMGDYLYTVILNESTGDLWPPKDGGVFLSTSGSTGTPKGIILSAKQCVLTAGFIAESHKLTEEDHCLTPLPFYHVNAPVVSLLATVLTGGQLTIANRYRTEDFWGWVAQYQPTWLNIVPTLVAMLLSTAAPSFLANSKVRFVRTASAPLPEANLRRFEATFGLPIIETYGISEAGSTICANPVPPGVQKVGSVGLPIGVELRVCRTGTSNELQQGSVGEVCIRGDNVITHYEADVGTDSFIDGWFRTGDLGKVDVDGYVFLTGRIKDIIVRGGENILPREIEEAIINFAGVSEAAVVGHPDPLYGEKVVAYVVTNDQVGDDFSKQLQAHLQQHLSRYKLPAEIHIVANLPRTHAGKIDKPQLRRGFNAPSDV